MDWMIKLKDLEDTAVGIYVKARINISERDQRTCPFYADGILAAVYGEDELDMDFVNELVGINYVKVQHIPHKLVLVLGEGGQWYTDPIQKSHPQHEFIALYSKLCATNAVDNNLALEKKTFGMIKQVMAKPDWREVLDFAFANWAWLKKELNVGLPTPNVLASDFYWRRIVNQMRNKPSIANRYTPTVEDDSWTNRRAPVR